MHTVMRVATWAQGDTRTHCTVHIPCETHTSIHIPRETDTATRNLNLSTDTLPKRDVNLTPYPNVTRATTPYTR